MPIRKIEETLDCLPENAKAIPGCKWFYATPEGKIYRIHPRCPDKIIRVNTYITEYGLERVHLRAQISRDKNTYRRDQLLKYDEDRKFFVHRIIAELFVPNPTNLPWVIHKNHDLLDNRAENLIWGKYRELGKFVSRQRTYYRAVRPTKLKPIVMYSMFTYKLIGYFHHYHDAAEQTGISVDVIQKECDQKKTPIRSYYFRYATDEQDFPRKKYFVVKRDWKTDKVMTVYANPTDAAHAAGVAVNTMEVMIWSPKPNKRKNYYKRITWEEYQKVDYYHHKAHGRKRAYKKNRRQSKYSENFNLYEYKSTEDIDTTTYTFQRSEGIVSIGEQEE